MSIEDRCYCIEVSPEDRFYCTEVSPEDGFHCIEVSLEDRFYCGNIQVNYLSISPLSCIARGGGTRPHTIGT